MYSRCFSGPEPALLRLLSRLYGGETAALLYDTYCCQLSSTALWQHRLDLEVVAVYENGEMLAHAVVQHVKDRPVVYAGYIEALDNPEAAALLVRSIRERLRSEEPGKRLYLPVDLSIWHSYRFKMAGEEPLPFDAPCMPYYATLFGSLLSEREFYSSYRMPLPALSRPDTDPRLRVRALSWSEPLRDLRTLYDLSAQIFRSEHSEPSFDEFVAIYGGMLGGAGVDPGLVLIAEDAPGCAVGFVFAVAPRRAVYLKTFGVLPEARRHGVARLLYRHLCSRARDLGCDTLYGLMIRNDRPVMRLLPRGARHVAEYVLFKDRT